MQVSVRVILLIFYNFLHCSNDRIVSDELMNQAAKRQLELKDSQMRDDLASARAVLKKHSTMLLTASKVIFSSHTTYSD